MIDSAQGKNYRRDDQAIAKLFRDVSLDRGWVGAENDRKSLLAILHLVG